MTRWPCWHVWCEIRREWKLDILIYFNIGLQYIIFIIHVIPCLKHVNDLYSAHIIEPAVLQSICWKSHVHYPRKTMSMDHFLHNQSRLMKSSDSGEGWAAFRYIHFLSKCSSWFTGQESRPCQVNIFLNDMIAVGAAEQTFTQCWFNGGPASQTLDQYWTSFGPMSCACN